MRISDSDSDNRRIDLRASAARLEAARRLAAEQAAAVAACKEGADEFLIDLLFLFQESVLVLDETHAMLTRAAVDERLREAAQETRVDARAKSGERRMSRPAVQVFSFLIFLVLASVLLEIFDPASMHVQAIGSGLAGTSP